MITVKPLSNACATIRPRVTVAPMQRIGAPVLLSSSTGATKRFLQYRQRYYTGHLFHLHSSADATHIVCHCGVGGREDVKGTSATAGRSATP
jgi:hypothetical protein